MREPGRFWLGQQFAASLELMEPRSRSGAKERLGRVSRMGNRSLPSPTPPGVLILHGYLRERSFSRSLAYEAARLLEVMGGEVRIYDAHSRQQATHQRRSPVPEGRPEVAVIRVTAST